MKRILPLREATVDSAGDKAYNLGKVSDQSNVPDGFVITDRAFREYLKNNGLKDKIFSILASADVEDKENLLSASKKIQELFDNARMSSSIREKLEEAYNDFAVSSEARKAGGRALEFITAGREQPSVTVRPSIKKSGSSFAGVFRNEINIKGEENLVKSVERVWKSYFTPEAIYYRERMDRGHDVSFGVIVQKLVVADKSLSFLLEDPQKKGRCVVEAVYGLGTVLAQGEINPDIYYLDQGSYRLIDKRVADKRWKVSKNPSNGDIEREKISRSKGESEVLNRDELNKVINMVDRIESNFNFSPIMDFSIRDGNVYLLDVGKVGADYVEEKSVEDKEELVSGVAVSPGSSVGEVTRAIDEGENKILVTKNLSLDGFYQTNFGGIVSYNGGFSSKVSRHARDTGIPVIVGTDAYQKLSTGQTVRVDGNSGKVFEVDDQGSLSFGNSGADNFLASGNKGYRATPSNMPVTATELFVFVNDSSGMGDAIDQAGGVIFEFSGSEYRSSFDLTGSSDRWVRRLVESTKEELWLKTDIEAGTIEKSVSLVEEMHRMGNKNLNILISGLKDLERISDIYKKHNIPADSGVGIVLEAPGMALNSNASSLRDIDFVLIDYDSLVTHTFGGSTRSNRFVKGFGTWDMMTDFLETCFNNDIKVGLIGSFDRAVLKKFIKAGISCLVVGADNFDSSVREIMRIEKKILLER